MPPMKPVPLMDALTDIEQTVAELRCHLPRYLAGEPLEGEDTRGVEPQVVIARLLERLTRRSARMTATVIDGHWTQDFRTRRCDLIEHLFKVWTLKTPLTPEAVDEFMAAKEPA